MTDFNQMIIDEFRANNGVVTIAGFGDTLVIMHTVGARTGEVKLSPVRAFADTDGWLVVASAAGAPRNPAWYHNLRAHPRIILETPSATLEVVATELSGDEHRVAWAAIVDEAPGFQGYQDKTDRLIPVLRLTPA